MLEKLQGIGKKRAEAFAKKGIHTVDDLLRYYPRAYEDRTAYKRISSCEAGETVCIKAKLLTAVKEARIRPNMTLYSAIIGDESGGMTVIWYNNRYVKTALKTHETYVFFGKVRMGRSARELVSPIYERLDNQKFTGIIAPVYSLNEDLTQTIVRNAVSNAIKEKYSLKEYIPENIRKKYGLCEINYAVSGIHFPKTIVEMELAKRRLAFEELYMLRLALLLRRADNDVKTNKPYKNTDCSEFVNKLPFELTNAQKRVISEISADLKSNKMMNRLVQGDVGSGKTAVAAAGVYMAIKNGGQAAVMAPTEILASQHFESFSKMLSCMGITVVKLTGNTQKKSEIYKQIKSGDAQLVVGTHAIIQKDVEFKNLTFAVVDEQHRFGVEQREVLFSKGNNPNLLVMSATPIPRTLALILYGDLDVSVIDELPAGRIKTETYVVDESYRKRVYAFLEKNIKTGMQAYVVCPLVEESEKTDIENATELCKKISNQFPDIATGLVHGKMRPSEKEKVMNGFANGEIDVLVSTTVIEVGVNVPNAGVMIIENAERFGLSQLHQLRGRVGRGNSKSYCILIAKAENEVTKERMKVIGSSTDGFYISEQDLKLRGPGDFFGTRQHGLPELKIANLFEDMQLLAEAQNAAAETVENSRFFTDIEFEPLRKHCVEILDISRTLN